MIFRLALKNVISKPVRSVATALAIAVAVAMIFTILSFKTSVYDYIFSAETAISGESDVLISTNSSSDRITQVSEKLYDVQGVKSVTPSLSLYATALFEKQEYVRARGFEKGHLQDLQKIDVISLRSGLRSLDDMRDDDVVISKSAAEHFGLDTQSSLTLSLGQTKKTFYVAAIARESGYFLDDSPYLILGNITEGVAGLIAGGLTDVCNEIYVDLEDGADVDEVIKTLSSMQPYDSMLISRTGDNGYIGEQVNALTAPVALAGAAVLALSLAIIFLLFMMSEQDKATLISRLRIVGATKGQLYGVFLTESAILSLAGVAIGSGAAVGIYALILKLTLSYAAISPAYLPLALGIGFVAAMLSSLAPIVRALSGTIRAGEVPLRKNGKLGAVAFGVVFVINLLLIALLYAPAVGNAVQKAAIAAASLACLLLLALSAAPLLMRGGAKLMQKGGRTKVAASDLMRQPRHSRAVTLLATGMTVSMLLFMAWSLTTSIFSSYVGDFGDMIFVNNIREDQDMGEFEKFEGVKLASKIVWQQGELGGNGSARTVNVIGSKHALDLVDFAYITDEKVVRDRLSGGGNYVFIDYSVRELYGINEGDEVTLTLGDEKKTLIVGGILKHRLFNGAYAVLSEDVINELYGIKVDMAVILADGGVDAIADELRQAFARNNLYVIKTLEAYKWEMQSTDAVFDLVGTLAVVVALFILIVSVAADLVGRTTEERAHTALLNAGMSKNMLLATELLEHCVVALTAFVVAMAISVPLTSALIIALRLFGLYFEFMYEAWVVVLSGAAMGAAYALTPLFANFKKAYSVKRR